MTLNGKVALMTGSAHEIGRGIAFRLAKDGADIAIFVIDTAKMADVATEIEELGRNIQSRRQQPCCGRACRKDPARARSHG